VVIAWPIIWGLFGRGAFDAGSAWLTAQALAVYAAGLPAFVLIKVLAPGFFARGDTATPVRIGVAMVGVHLVLNLSFMGPFGHLGPPAATSLAASVNAAWLWLVLWQRGQLRVDERLRTRLPRLLPAVVLMGGALWGGAHVLFDASAGSASRLLVLALLTLIGLLVYGVALRLFGAGLVQEVIAGLRRPSPPP
jgi:putative peptidoglycan lipid II flippase